MENRTARLTLLIDPKKKEVFEKLCDQDDVTPSQLIRKFIRDYIEGHMGPDWQDKVFGDQANKGSSGPASVKQPKHKTS